MNKEDRKQYVFAQLNSLPNAFQRTEVTKYINSLEKENTNLKQALIDIRDFSKLNMSLAEDNNQDSVPKYVVKDILQIIDKVDLGDEK